MNRSDLPDDAHVVRYARPTAVREDGRVDGSAFRLRAGDAGLSVNWLECFTDLPLSGQLAEVRRLSRIEMRPNGRLAELNVGAAKQHVRQQFPAVRFISTPLPGRMDTLPTLLTAKSSGCRREIPLKRPWLETLIAECVRAAHPVVA